MNEEERRNVARALMVNATDVEYLDIVEELEMDWDAEDIETDASAIFDLTRSAKVTITWGDDD